MTFAIRAADPNDPVELDRIGEITVAAYLDGGHLPAEADYAGTLRDARTRAKQAELWTAVGEDGDLLGSITFAPPGSAFNEVSERGEGELRMLAVAHDAQGRGIGLALVRHCLERARELGLTAIALSTQPSMRTAHRIYEGVGFVRTPAKDWDPVPGVHLLTYRLDL